MFNTMIFAIEGPGSEPALPAVRELSDRFLSKVVIVHVKELVHGRGALPLRADEKRVQQRLHELVATLQNEGIDASLELHSAVEGHAAKIIAEAAERHDADLIVVSPRGQSPVFGVLSGSITQRLLHLAPCPVLAVPTRSNAQRFIPRTAAA